MMSAFRTLMATAGTTPPTPPAASFILTSGDMQAGTDKELLSGDMQSGTDKLEQS